MDNKIVSRDAWLAARNAHLDEEKALLKRYDALAAKRRELPWLEIAKPYTFDSRDGKCSLSDLFAGRSQLFIKHFMLAPGRPEQCVGCSFEVDHVERILEHLENHDVTYVVVARAPLAEIEIVRQRMGWRCNWVSSSGTDFNNDFNVSFTPDEIESGRAFYNFRYTGAIPEDLSGDSVFYRDATGRIFLTYATFGRGGEQFLGVYRILDVMPKGRDENGPYRSLADWVKPRNEYGRAGLTERNGRYRPAEQGCAAGDT